MVYITECYVFSINIHLTLPKFTLSFNKLILKNFPEKIKIVLKFEPCKRLEKLPTTVLFFRNKTPAVAVHTACLPVVHYALLQIRVQLSSKARLEDSDTDPSSLHIIRVWKPSRPRFWLKTPLRGLQPRSRFQLYLHLYKARRVLLKL